ncbi:tudor domain-containing protein 1 [Poecile atricapillus]|uniref:tudor domain-containing protein 1 n=1 Tax=Poecile atricapillus TaxID=48891 RepID=UPI002739254A|nr:tudor domain-containing protein 1 [Poecile atricapillus]
MAGPHPPALLAPRSLLLRLAHGPGATSASPVPPPAQGEPPRHPGQFRLPPVLPPPPQPRPSRYSEAWSTSAMKSGWELGLFILEKSPGRTQSTFQYLKLSLTSGGRCFLSSRRRSSSERPALLPAWGSADGGEAARVAESAFLLELVCGVTSKTVLYLQVSHSNWINGKPKKLQCSSKSAFSICYDKSFLSLLVPPPKGGTCHRCGLFGKLRCSQCLQTYYCSVDCQKKDWPAHRVVCDPIKQNSNNNKTKTGVYLKEEVRLSFAVDVVLPDSEDCQNKVPLEMKSHLTSGIDAKGDSPRVSENHSKGSEKKMLEDEDSSHCTNSVAKFVSLSTGDEFSGVVSHIQNPDTFFCQRMQSACQLAELEASLNEYCDRFPGSPSFRPAAGNVCCAQFTEDNLWYRAAVTAYVSEDTVLVDYMDYGNSDSLPLTRLRPIIPRLTDLPAQAIRCSLAGVKPPLGTWTSEGISCMKKMVKDKVLTVKVVDKKNSRTVVQLTDASGTPAVNIASRLIEEGFAAEELSMALPAARGSDVEQANEDTTNKRMCKWIKLTLNQTLSVIVCTVYNPGEFYCQISNSHELLSLNSLNKSLSEHCQKTPPDVFEPKNGDPCCAFYSEDGNWYRAVVQNVTSDGIVRVSFVDYGNTEEVPLDNIRQISSSFLKLPFQAIKCWLSGIKPGNSKWSPEATKRFHMYASGLELQATVTSLSEDGAGVVLTDNSTDCPKMINEILTSEKLVVKEVLQDNNNFPKSVDQKATSLGHWKSIELAVDETMSVWVTEVVSPDLFYAVPVPNKGQKQLLKELISLEDYCRSCNKQPFQPKLGEACCAQFSGNGNWYRAIVLEASQSSVKVLYGDFGCTETLPLSKVLPITDSYLKLPFQTITCSLAGIEKAEWSPLVLDTLKKLLLKQHVTITVKGINGNVNLVTVEKHFDNGYVNVADKLLKEGLVTSCSPENSHGEHQGNGGETNCCCMELKVQLEKHKQVLLFLLNKFGNPDGFSDMKNLLEH